MGHHIQLSPIHGLIIEWILAFTAFAMVSLRIYLRYFRQSLFSISDGMICFSLLFFFSCVANDTVLVAYGFWDTTLSLLRLPISSGHPSLHEDPANLKSIYDVFTIPEATNLLKMMFAASFPYFAGMWTVKVCLLMLYYTIIPRCMPKTRFCLNATSAIVGFTFLVVILMNALWCYPISRNWTPTFNPRGEQQMLCMAGFEPVVYFTAGGLHILTEILIFCLPWSVLRALHVSERQRKAIYAMFSLGFITIIVGVGRMVCIITMDESGQVVGICQVWGCIEMCISICIVCMPALKGLLGGLGKKKSFISSYTNKVSNIREIRRRSQESTKKSGTESDEEASVKTIGEESRKGSM